MDIFKRRDKENIKSNPFDKRKTAILRFGHLWGHRGNVTVHLRLIGKRTVHDFLLMIIELFSLGVTAAALLTKID